MKKNFECRLTALEKITRIPPPQENPEIVALLESLEQEDALLLARIAERIVDEGGPLNDCENADLEAMAEKYS